MDFALDFVRNVLKDLEVDASAEPVKDENGAYVGINVKGENTGILIGHHGETLDAVQYLTNLCASRRSPTPNREFTRMFIDVENYRAKREATLRALARKMADKAVKYRRNFVLDPMNPYERRIIHSELQNTENVSTHSVGSDDNRKVVVTYEGPDRAPMRDRRRPMGGGHRGSARPYNRLGYGTRESTAESSVQGADENITAAAPQEKSYVMFDNTVPRNFDGWGKTTDDE